MLLSHSWCSSAPPQLLVWSQSQIIFGGGWNAELRAATKQPPKLRTVHGRVHETSDKDAHAVSG